MSVEMSDAMIACDTTSFLQKVAYRTTTLAGAADSGFLLIFSLFGFLGHYNSFFRSSLYDVFYPMFESVYYFYENDKQLTCLEVGFILGQVPKAVLNVDTPREVFYRNVNAYTLRDKPFVCIPDENHPENCPESNSSTS